MSNRMGRYRASTNVTDKHGANNKFPNSKSQKRQSKAEKRVLLTSVLQCSLLQEGDSWSQSDRQTSHSWTGAGVKTRRLAPCLLSGAGWDSGRHGAGRGLGFTTRPSANADFSSTAKPFFDTFLAKKYHDIFEDIKRVALKPTRFDMEPFLIIPIQASIFHPRLDHPAGQ